LIRTPDVGHHSSGEQEGAGRTAVDLFAGCGGLSLGLENAGFTTVFVNELNDDARATYLANRHHSLGGEKFSGLADLRCSDVGELTRKRLTRLKSDLENISEFDIQFDRGGQGTLDLLSGGPPCQGFSGIGIRRSYSVDRKDIPSNQLYRRMADVIRSLRPRIFLFENVRGLLWAKWTQGGTDKIFPDVLAEFRSIPGYEVRWSLVHAKDYGVPQNRPRVLLVGIRKDILSDSKTLDPSADEEDAVACGFLPAPDPNMFPHLEELLSDLVDPSIGKILKTGEYPKGKFKTHEYPRTPKKNGFQDRLRENHELLTGPVKLTDHEYSRHSRNVVEKFQYMLDHDSEILEKFKTKKFSQRCLPPVWGNKGPTITATSLPDDYVHYEQPRILTVREWARLQLFPDWYQFKGKRTTGGLRRAGNPREGLHDREAPKYTQIGNAVPVRLAEYVGKHFMEVLDAVLL
jgi:DNA (cytosine-5)-methyltransferase 1